MLQNEVSESSVVYGIDDFIRVRKWLIDPNDSETGRVDYERPPVLLARSAIAFARVEGHLLHLHTAAGDEYVCRGTLRGLQRRWPYDDLVRIHSRFLVFLPHVRELSNESQGPVMSLGSGAGVALLPVSREQVQKVTRLWEAYKSQQ